MEEREVTGHFWTPDRPPSEPYGGVGGVLTFSEHDGLFIELMDQLGPNRWGDSIELILGVTHDGNEVTLLDCLPIHSNVSTTLGGWEISKASYSPQLCYLGAHLPEEADRRFIDATVQIEGLELLVPASSFETDFPADRDVPSRATYKRPAPLEARLDDLAIRIDSRLRGAEAIREVLLSESVVFDLEFGRPISLTELRSRYIWPLVNLVTLLTDHPARISRIGVHSESAREPNRPEYFRPVEVLYTPIGSREPRRRHHRPLLQLTDASVEFSDVLQRWIGVSDDNDLGPVTNAYFGIQYAPPGFVELRFLTMATALESYHERRYPGATQLREGKFQNLFESTMDWAGKGGQMNSKDRSWLKNALKQANRPALFQRYNDLIAVVNTRLPTPFSEPKLVAERLANTRNHLAHGSDSLADRALLGLDRFWGEQMLRVMLATLMMGELGYPDDAISSAWRSSPWYSWARTGIDSIEWASAGRN